MSRGDMKCPNCSSSNIVEDDLYAQSQLVCADCGSVLSEGSLANDPVGGTGVSYSQSTHQSKRPCSNLLKGLVYLRALCRVLRANNEIAQLSKDYYSQAYQHESFIRKGLTKKEALIGACVLVSCRLHNWPVTMGTVSYLADVDISLLGTVYQETLKTLNIQAPALCLSDVMEGHCQEYKITSEHVPDELAVDIKDLTKRAMALIELAAESWIVTGRRPVPIMIAATYLSWQSLQPTKLRLKISLEKFCQIAKVNKNMRALIRVAEMKKVLCKLGSEIPWEKRPVTPRNVVQQVEDILSYRWALMKRAMNTHEGSLQTELQDCEKDSADKETMVAGEENLSKTPDTEQQAIDGSSTCVSEPNWGKSMLFAPPCVINPKKRKRMQSAQMGVTGDEEISDSEINSYIRSPQEVRDLVLTQKLLLPTKGDK